MTPEAKILVLRTGILELILLGSLPGCTPDPRNGFSIVAPTFDAAEARLTSYVNAPVGVFATERSQLVSFVDANGDGKFDPDSEASGRCDQQSRQCWIDNHRLRIIMSTTDCSLQTGTWIIGSAYAHDGRIRPSTLCEDDEGVCSATHEETFQGSQSLEPVNGIWIPSSPNSSQIARARTLSLRAGNDEFQYENIELPAALHMVNLKVERNGDLHIFVAADQSIDMAALWVTRGDALQWSSSDGRGSFHAGGTELEASVPKAVLESCGGACKAYLQFSHVWRDDSVLSIAQVKQRVL